MSGREGPSHIFFDVAAGLTLSHYAEGSSPFVKGAAAVGDLVNPLTIPQDVIDIYQTVKALVEKKQ